jgi:hypothetical protein
VIDVSDDGDVSKLAYIRHYEVGAGVMAAEYSDLWR